MISDSKPVRAQVSLALPGPWREADLGEPDLAEAVASTAASVVGVAEVAAAVRERLGSVSSADADRAWIQVDPDRVAALLLSWPSSPDRLPAAIDGELFVAKTYLIPNPRGGGPARFDVLLVSADAARRDLSIFDLVMANVEWL